VLEEQGDPGQLLPRLLRLLAAIEQEGNLLRAARSLDVSYRHAWGLVREGGRALGAPLLTMSRGRGAALSVLGQKLLWADKRVAARLAPIFDNLATELQMEIDRALHDPQMIFRVRASHGFAIDLLRELMVEDRVPVDLQYCGSMEALASLAASECEIAGFHVPLGTLQREALGFYEKWLRVKNHTLITLSTRRQGIMVAGGNPKGVLCLADLARPGLRFVNRQFGSGTRILLDVLLRREGIASAGISGYESGEFTHSAVAAYIASGMADAGFGVETAARRFDLDFIPVATERYFLLCHDDSLASPFVARLLEILLSHRFRVASGKLPGIDVTHAGSLLAIEEAFPELGTRGGKAPAREAARKPSTRAPS
jgi:molybdate transport repressor ModE-like protein